MRREVVLGKCIWDPILEKGKVVGVSNGTIEKAMVVSFRLSIVTIELSL